MPNKKRKPQRASKEARSRKELEKSLSTVRAELTRTEKALTKAKHRADRWRNEAKVQQKSASRAGAQVEKLRQRLDGTRAAPGPAPTAASTGARAPGRSGTEPTAAATEPDETWSVVRLRAEARTRGLTGMSSKTKAQLLAALS